jgi:hypothetical protein
MGSEDVLDYIDNETRTANIIVGNSAAGDRARFNCHVEDDIQAGINLLPTTGGVLHVKRGDYTVSAALTFPGPNFTIQGEADTVILKGGNNVLIDITDEDDITIKGISFDGEAEAGGNPIINIANAERIKILDCKFFDNGDGECILITGTLATGPVEDVWIERCDFLGPMDQAIEAVTPGTEVAVRVKGIYVLDCVIDTTTAEGILFDWVEQCSIRNTMVRDAGTEGISITGDSGGKESKNIIVDGCWVDSPGDDCVEINLTDDSVFTGIIMTGLAAEGLRLTDSDNNMVSNCSVKGGAGIAVNVTNAGCTDNIITSNHLSGNGATSLADSGTDTITGLNQI